MNIDFKNKRNIYAIVCIVLVLAGGWFFYDMVLDPFEMEKQDYENKIDKFQKDLNDINRQKNRRKQLKQQMIAAQDEFKRLKEMFPEQEEVPKRLQDLYSVIRSSGVAITDFSPAKRMEKEYYIEHSYSIGINAGYHMLGYLLAEIANFVYPVSITNLSINRYSGIDSELKKAALNGWTPITMKVNFSLTTYTSKIAKAKSKKAEKGKSKKGKK